MRSHDEGNNGNREYMTGGIGVPWGDEVDYIAEPVQVQRRRDDDARQGSRDHKPSLPVHRRVTLSSRILPSPSRSSSWVCGTVAWSAAETTVILGWAWSGIMRSLGSGGTIYQ